MVTWSERRRPLGLVVMFFIVTSAIVSLPSVPQASTECGTFYRIKRGDTLRDITVRALGHDRYRVVYQANRDILPSPERLETGQLIFVPCKNGSVRDRKTALAKAAHTPTPRDNLGDRAAATVPQRDSSVKVVTPFEPKLPTEPGVDAQDPTPAEQVRPSEASQAAKRGLRILTASGMSPLADFSLPDGGLLSVLVRDALRSGGDQTVQDVSFVDDRKSHLSILMPTGAFDLTFPWPGVDCEAAGLGAAATALCQDFVISRPIYETSVKTLVPADSPLAVATSSASLSGRRICRPAGFPPVDLEALRPRIQVVVKRTASDCVEFIRAGLADALSLPDGQLKEAAWTDLVNAPGLTRTVPVHALAWRKSANAENSIATLNAGLERLQRSGQWFKIVSGYLRNINSSRVAVGN